MGRRNKFLQSLRNVAWPAPLRRYSSPGLSVLLLSLALVSASCSAAKPKFQEQFGPDVQVGFLVFFNTEAKSSEINDFWDNVLMKPESGGHQVRSGVGGISRLETIQGHISVGVSLTRDVTVSQREEIKSRIMASPIVYKVFENVIPADIRNVE